MDVRQRIQSLRWLVTMPANKADIAVLKAEALGTRESHRITELLHDVRGYLPPIDMDALRKLPDGTFGREYVRHLDACGLEPFVVSPWISTELLARHTFLVRLTACHDMLHLLVGFDVSVAGEMGVFAFTVGQRYSRAQSVGLWFVRLLYPLFFPRQARAILDAVAYGVRVGREAKPVLAVRLEEHFARPLVEVRRDLGLPLRPATVAPIPELTAAPAPR